MAWRWLLIVPVPSLANSARAVWLGEFDAVGFPEPMVPMHAVANGLEALQGKSGAARIEAEDLEGQAHLTAVGAVVAAESALELDGAEPAAARVWFPEQFSEPEHALGSARTLGVEVTLQ